MRSLFLYGTASAVALTAAFLSAPAQAQDEEVLDTITVTGTREGERKSETPAAITVIDQAAIHQTMPSHPSEIMTRVPGAVLMQTNGEGHTTGIRQPIGTDAVYLYLEDNIPTRATGFFNHNAMMEVDLPNAGGLEVTRGPGSALQGSDAIGAVFNTLSRAPSTKPEVAGTVETGSFGWLRFLGTASNSWGETGARGNLNITHTDGWRDRTEYDRQSASMRIDQGLSGDAYLKALVSATNAEMQTGAGARLTKMDYMNSPTNNYHSLAYRRIKAFRGSVSYEQEKANSSFSVTPFVRWNEMDLLASFLMSSDPSQALSSHHSLGVQTKYRQDFAPWRTRLVTGLDLDYSPGSREEDRLQFVKDGEYFSRYTNRGRIYDYDVTYTQISPFIHGETSPVTPLRLSAGLRFDSMSYDYENHLSSGSFIVPGALEGGANSTYYRPNDTSRYFSHLSPSLGATWAFDPTLNAFARYKHSFRAPSESQLFRSGQNVDSVHLQPVKVDNYELGLRGPDKGDFTWEGGLFHMIKRDDILTVNDASQRVSANNGKTRHYGVEGAASWKFLPDWTLGGSASYARHRYATWVTRLSNSANVTYTGNDLPSAPRVVSSMTLGWTPRAEALAGLSVEGEWTHLGPYKMDDANTNTYQGHHLFNLRSSYALTQDMEVFARVMNVLDARWATAATISNSREEFQPGTPRTFYAGMSMKF